MPADLVRADVRDVASLVERRRIDRLLVQRAAHVLELHVADVHVGLLRVQRVPADALRIGRADDDVARQVADVRRAIEPSRRVARALVIELQGARRA